MHANTLDTKTVLARRVRSFNSRVLSELENNKTARVKVKSLRVESSGRNDK